MKLADFDAAAAAGLVSVKERRSLALYCYTPKCAHERVWTPVTRAARGIIFDRSQGNVVARPFDKFFNLGELPETSPDALPATGFRVEEKLDGSLGIIWHHDGVWDITTKGAFDSEQAQHARGWLLGKYDLTSVHKDLTVLVEMIYPENRIVIDYADTRELVLLAARWRMDDWGELPESGLDRLSRSTGMGRVRSHAYRNLLDLPFADDSEGYVVRFDNGLRVKIKSPHYVKIHRFLEYRSPRRILDMIADGTYEEVRNQIPDAIAGDFDDVSATLRMALRQIKEEAAATFGAISHLRDDRKAFAMAAKEHASTRALPLVFGMLDGKDVERMAVRAVRNELRPDPEEQD